MSDVQNASPVEDAEEAEENQTSAGADYPRPDLEPTTEEERLHRKNPLGYSVTEQTEDEIESGDKDEQKSPQS